MRVFYFLLISMSLFSFCPLTEKTANNSRPGFYVFVEDHTDRTFHKFIVESKDSVDNIFEHFFESELDLGNVDHP